MSVQTEIARIAQAKTDIKNVVNSKVANTITNQTIDAFPPLIDSSIAAYKNLIPWIEGSGSSFTIDNAEAGKLDKFEMYGNTEQTTYTGKNLVDFLNPTGTYKCTYNSTTNIYTSNVLTGSWEGLSTYNNHTLISIEPGANEFYYSADIRMVSGTYTSKKLNLIRSGTALTDVTSSVTAIANPDLTNSFQRYIFKVIYTNNSENTKTTDSTFIQLITGADNVVLEAKNIMVSTNNNATYEPYVGGTPSPSPDFPQDVRVVTGEQDIEISGKNLAKSKTVYSTTNNYAKVLYVDFDIKPNTTYTFSFNGTSGNTVYFNENIFTTANYVTISNNRVKSTVTTKSTILSSQYEDGKGWAILKNAAGNTNANVFDDLQVEYGSTATPYEPYQSQTYPINLGVENLFDKDNTTILNAYIDTNIIDISAKAKTTYIPCKPNTTYTIQKRNDGNNNRFTIATTTVLPAINVSVSQYNNNNSASTMTITTNSTANYLCLTFYHTDETTLTQQQVLDSIQIEKGSKASPYTPYGATPIELCKIGNYQDYIYKENNKWYKHSEIGKVVLDGTQDILFEASASTPTPRNVFRVRIPFYPKIAAYFLSNRFIVGSTTSNRIVLVSDSYYQYISVDDEITNIDASDTNEEKIQKFKTWVTNNNVVIYVIINATNEEITDTTLISQLNAIETYNGTNIFSVSNSNGVLPDLYVLTEKQNSYKN